MMGRGSVTLALTLAVLAGGCGDKKSGSKPAADESDSERAASSAVRSSSASPAEEPPGGQRRTDNGIVDLDYRFHVDLPTKQHSILSQADAAAYDNEAVAVLVGPDDSALAVHAVEMPEGELGALVAGIAVEMKGQGTVEVSEIKDDTWKGEKVKRYSAVFGGRRNCFLYLRRQSFVFALSASPPATVGAPADCAVATPLLDAITFDEGPVRARLHAGPIADAHGPGVRIRDSVFESAAGGYRLKLPRGARVYDYDRLQQALGEADVAFDYGRPSCSLTIRTSSAGSFPERQSFFETMRQTLARSLGATILPQALTWQVLGRPIAISKWLGPRQVMFYGIIDEGTRVLETLVRCPAGVSDKTVAEAEALVGSMEKIEESARTALAKELGALPRTDNAADSDVSLRNGRYVHHTLGLSWTVPPGAWHVQFGQRVAGASPKGAVTILHVTERDLGIAASVNVVAAGADAAVFHDLVVASYPGFKPSPPSKATLRGAPALVSVGEAPNGAYYRIVTALWNGAGVVLSVGTTPALVRDQEQAILAVERGLTFAPAPHFEQKPASYVDHQLGFELALPAPWTLRPEVEAQQRRVVSQNGAGFVELHAVPNVRWGSSDYLVTRAIVARLAAKGIALGAVEPKLTDTTLGGQPAKRYAWPDALGGAIDGVAVNRDRIVYVLVTRGDGALAAASAGMRFLP